MDSRGTESEKAPSEQPISPEENLENLKLQLVDLALLGSTDPKAIKEGWILYEQIYLTQKVMDGKPETHASDEGIDCLISAIEAGGCTTSPRLAENVLADFKKQTEIVPNVANPGILVKNRGIAYPSQQLQAQRFFDKMEEIATQNLRNLHPIALGNRTTK